MNLLTISARFRHGKSPLGNCSMRCSFFSLCLMFISACLNQPITPDPNFAPVPIPAIPQYESKNGAIFQDHHDMRLFEDRKARNVGDILTVRLVEKLNASKKASTNTKKSSDASIVNPTLFGTPFSRGGVNLGADLNSNQDFKGEGDSTQSNTISGSITVTVAQVLPNGNLVVRGEKLMTINHGDEYVRFSGIVRPIDIDAANTVASTQVANSRIIYGGEGSVANASSPGWLMRFFNSPWWPF